MANTNDLMLTWTQPKPSQAGWYWMLDPSKELRLPTIVQIMFDRDSQRWLALIPASQYPKTSGMVLDLENLDAMWAGPLEIPSLASSANQEENKATSATRGEDTNLAA